MKELRVDGVVCAVDIDRLTGDIATCTECELALWSVNGDLLAYHHMKASGTNERVTCCVLCPPSAACMAVQSTTLFTAHANGDVCVWNVDSGIEVDSVLWSTLQERCCRETTEDEFKALKAKNRVVTSPFPDPRPTQMLPKYVLPCLSPVTALCVSPSQLRVSVACENGALIHFVTHEALNADGVTSTYSLSLLSLTEAPSAAKAFPQTIQLKDPFEG